jgi:hypothetical protein
VDSSKVTAVIKCPPVGHRLQIVGAEKTLTHGQRQSRRSCSLWQGPR